MSWPGLAYALLLTGLFGALAAAPAEARNDSAALPPVPRGPVEMEDVTLHLELVVNQLATDRIVPVVLRDGHYHVAAGDLRSVGLSVDGDDDRKVAIDSMAGVVVEYDTANLRLLLTVPTDWLPRQHIGSNGRPNRIPARSSFGALVNYEAYVSDPDRGPAALSVWNELRMFGAFGLFSTTGIYQYVAGSGRARNGFIRYDTRWRYSDEERMRTYEAGDLIAGGVAWGSVVRIGGIQLSRDFLVRPDVVTYPLPEFSGEATVPTTVDLFINGYRAAAESAKPGPFTLTNIPFINGAGEAVITVTDALGRRVSTTIPFYVSNDLLRKGLADYSLAFGSLRRNYGLKNFSYGDAVASGSWRYGATDSITMEAHVEAAPSLGLVGVGGVFRLGNLGVVNAAFSYSRQNGRDGRQISVGYQYAMRGFNLAAQHSRRSPEFADLSRYGDSGVALSRQTTSVTASVGLNNLGSLGVGYFDAEARDRRRTRLVNLSWGLPIWGNNSLYLSANREIGRGSLSAALQLVVPLSGNRGSVNASVERSGDRGTSWRANYNRAVPGAGGIGWNMAIVRADRSDTYLQADLAWRDAHAELRGGIYGGGGDYTRWGSVSGSLVAMDGSLFAANRINDAFAVVSTDGRAGIPVLYENQPAGKTNGNGHVLIPWASAYYPAKYEIDPLDLPPSIEAPMVEQKVAVRRGSGYLVDFPVRRVVAARIILHGKDGKPLPVGTLATVDGGATVPVGWDGLVYLENLKPHNRLIVQNRDGSTCRVEFATDVAADRIADIGPLVCR